MIKELLNTLSRKSTAAGNLKKKYVRVRDETRGVVNGLLPVNEKLIIFESYHGKHYVDSPKAIYEYLRNHTKYRDYHFIWCFQEPDKYTFLADARTSLVKHESAAYYRAYARSKYWIVNGWISLEIRKKSAQVMLQCWHGTPLKRLRHDIGESVKTKHRQTDLITNDIDVLRYDYFLSPSKYASNIFKSAFNLGKFNVKVLETGYPRNDFLHTFTPKDVTRVKKTLNIPTDKKVLLYAPTWRDDQFSEGGGYTYKTEADFDALQKGLGDEWVILFRAHSIVANSFNFKRHKNFIIDASNYDDINDLYIASDALMTDYSSVFFDYANLKRPIIFFMYDLEHYQKDLRGFYLDLKDLPGRVVKTETEVIGSLGELTSYEKKYKKTYDLFNKTYNYLDDGSATERVVKRVIER